jgi:hypothetical protein
MLEAVVAGVPIALIDAGVNVHAAPAGSPVQARAMVPVKPVDEEIVTDVDPVDPGAEIVTCDWVGDKAAKNPGWIVKLIDCVVLLALKLVSPT